MGRCVQREGLGLSGLGWWWACIVAGLPEWVDRASLAAAAAVAKHVTARCLPLPPPAQVPFAPFDGGPIQEDQEPVLEFSGEG